MSRFCWIYAIMLVLAAFLASWAECPSLFRVPPSGVLLWGPVLVAIAFSATVVLGGIALERISWYREMELLLKRLLTSPEVLGPEQLDSKALVIAVYSGIGEEAFFRGFLQFWLIARFESWLDAPGDLLPAALGILAASLIFGLLHFPVIKELRPWTVFAIVAGLVFGVLAVWSQSLLAPVLAHFLINWLNLRRLARVR